MLFIKENVNPGPLADPRKVRNTMPLLDLSKMTKDELLRLAEKIKVPVKKSMLKGEILAVLKKETKKAAKLAEAKKTKTRAVKATAKKASVSGKKVVAKKTVKDKTPKKSVKPKSTKPAAPVKKKTAQPKKPTSIHKAKPIVDKDKAHKAPLKSVAVKKSKRPATRKKPVARKASPSAKENQGVKGYDIQSLHPKFELEDAAQEAKFILGKPDIRDESRAEVSPDLPLGYGDNKVVMLVRDPHWCYLYWELQETLIEDGLRRLSRSRHEVRHVLRIHPAGGTGTPFDVDIDFRAQSHYQQLSPGASFYSEIGLLDHEGFFAALAVSNTVTLPLDGPSEIIDEQWITTDENFTEIYMLSGGELTETGKTRGDFGQAGSRELQKSATEQLTISSPGVGSFGSAQFPAADQKKNFSFWLDTELIIYGGADAGSTILLSGKKLNLRPDGTFTARFSLPEGELKLPVTFISQDRSEAHTVTPKVTRRTETKTGESDQ